MPIAARFVGAWRRRSIAIDGGPPEEPSRAVWLQARDAFADLRLPIRPDGVVDAFAGVTTYDAPALTWHHSLDLHGTFADFDCGVVDCRNDEMIERGSFEHDGRRLCYEEVWNRVDRGAVGLVLTAPDAIVVRVGDHAIAMRDGRRTHDTFDVRYTCVCSDRWTDVSVLGDSIDLPCPPVDVPRHWAPGSLIELAGRPWRVAERWS